MNTIFKKYSLPLEANYVVGAPNGSMLLQERMEAQKRDELQWYYNDLYQYFLYKLTQATHDSTIIPDADMKKMMNMLEEILTVKNMLEGKEA